MLARLYRTISGNTILLGKRSRSAAEVTNSSFHTVIVASRREYGALAHVGRESFWDQARICFHGYNGVISKYCWSSQWVNLPSVTWCHHVALRGSLGPQPVMVSPYVSRVLYSYAYVGPCSVWPSREENEFTSAFQLWEMMFSHHDQTRQHKTYVCASNTSKVCTDEGVNSCTSTIRDVRTDESTSYTRKPELMFVKGVMEGPV